MFEALQLTSGQEDQFNDWAPLFSFQADAPLVKEFLNDPQKIKCIFSGNQGGKTSRVAWSYALRVAGLHPRAEMNLDYFRCEDEECVKFETAAMGADYEADDRFYHKVAILTALHAGWTKDRGMSIVCPQCKGVATMYYEPIRIFRFCSELLPTASGDLGQKSVATDGEMSDEVKNTTYPEFKKWLPSSLIIGDITSRNLTMKLLDIWGGPNIMVEFVGYNQGVQATAGPQRKSIWCVAEGQRVLMSDGVWRNIENIKPRDKLICETIGGHGDNQRENHVKGVVFSGEKEVLKIKCQKGICFEVTPDHLVMVPSQGKGSYKKASSLKVGDHVKCRISDIGGKRSISDWYIKTLALLIGDGCLTGRSPKITNGNDEIMAGILKGIPNPLRIRIQEMPGDHVPDYFIASETQGTNEMKVWLKELGMWGKKAHEKFIPDEIFRQDDRGIKYFLSYLYAADGWASGKSIGYASTSYRLAEDIFLLLRRFGIRSSRSEKVFTNGWRKQYFVTINQAYDVLRFIELVGIEGKHAAIEKVKVEAERRYKSRLKTSPFSNTEEINITRKTKQYLKIKAIESVGIKKVYDITMEPHDRSPRNNFLISGGVVVHNCDEEAPPMFIEEQWPRLIAADGDMIFSMTAANRLTTMFDDYYERAEIWRRSPIVAEVGEMAEYEEGPNKTGIASYQAATDDNPTLKPFAIERLFTAIADYDALMIRRYGLFKAITGRILKSWDSRIHIRKHEELFGASAHPPAHWTHGRAIDYHPAVPWHYVGASLSPEDELFLWSELMVSSEVFTTEEIAEDLFTMHPFEMESGIRRYHKYTCDLIDPLASQKQPNTKLSPLDDLNTFFLKNKRAGRTGSAYWRSWDTKSLRGRENLRLRLKNAKEVGEPYNNEVLRHGKKVRIPTVWVSSQCPGIARHLKNWRLEEWQTRDALATKDQKETPQQKWSHFVMAIEALLKEQAFVAPRRKYINEGQYVKPQRKVSEQNHSRRH